VNLLARARGIIRSNAAIYLLGTIASRIGAIVLIPLYTRRLTPADYGEFSLAISLLQLLPMCTSLGLTAGIARVFFDASDREAGMRSMGAVARGMVFLVIGMLAVLATGLGLFAPDILFGISRGRWFFILAAAAGTVFAGVPDLLFRVTQQPKRAVALQLTTFFLTAGLGVAFVLGLNRGLDGAVAATALSALCVGAFGVFFITTRLPTGDIRSETRRALGISIPLLPHYLAGWLQLTADRWILTAFGATSSLGAYYLATQLLTPIPLVVGAWNDAESPRYGEVYRDGGVLGAYRALRRQYRNYFLAALVPAAAALVASPLLPLIIGAKFLGAIAALPPLALSYVLDSFYFPASNYLFYVGRTRLIPVVTVTSAAVGLAAALLLLPRFGLPGLLGARVIASLVKGVVGFVAVYLARPRSA
jgi:O-antigen/teichoic acid export membrane protein